MDQEDLKALNRARVTAGWSYLGVLVPLVGWILGVISLSNLGGIDTNITEKAKRRVKAVKNLAVGGIVLSSVVAVLFGSLTVWGAYVGNKEQKQAQQAKLQADEQSCEQQVIQISNKIYALNAEYTTDATHAFDNSLNPTDECKKGTSVALADAQTNYNNALSATKQRCFNAANDTYNKYLQLNGVYTGKDSSGQPVYRMSQVNWDYVDKQLQQNKDNCNQLATAGV